MSIPFKQAVANLNAYWIPPSLDNPSGDLGQVTKNWRNQPRKIFLSFAKFKFVGIAPTTYLVAYTLTVYVRTARCRVSGRGGRGPGIRRFPRGSASPGCIPPNGRGPDR